MTFPEIQHVSRRALLGITTTATLALGVAPAQAVTTSSQGWRPTSGTNRSFQATNGVRLRYHYSVNGVNWDRPAGAVLFFDGDGTTRFDQPNGSFARTMARVAAASNKAFVFVGAPNNSRSWRAGDTSAIVTAVRQFATSNIVPTVDAPILLVGYSGGAEFVGGQLLLAGMQWLPGGSGAVMIGGGGTYHRSVPRATVSTADLGLTWVIGSNDGAYATRLGDWSAEQVASRARAKYRGAGYTRTQFLTVPGGHTQYDIPAIVSERLTALSR